MPETERDRIARNLQRAWYIFWSLVIAAGVGLIIYSQRNTDA